MNIDDLKFGNYVVTEINVTNNTMPVYSNTGMTLSSYAIGPEIEIKLIGDTYSCVICGKSNCFICERCQLAVEKLKNKFDKLDRI